MRIVLAISSLSGGGAERVMTWLAGMLSEHGHEVTMLTMYGPEADRYVLDPRVTRHSLILHRYFNSSRLSAIINFLRWRRLLISQSCVVRADVVLSFMDGMNVYCLASLLGYRTPVVVSERIDPSHSRVTPLKAWLRPWLYRRRAADVVFQITAFAERYRAEWRLPKVRVISNAVLPRFTGAGSAQRQPVVLSVGRLDPQKGHDVLLEAWRRLGADRQGWRLRIVGEGPERDRYESIAREFGISNSVELAPFSNDVVSSYNEASIFVFPSRFEGFPNALIEAMAMGNAVIASDLPPACREIVAHEDNGLLFDGMSAEALAETLKRLIGDSALRGRLAEAALDIRTRYSEAHAYALWEQCLLEARA